jgi:hypothetical protein
MPAVGSALLRLSWLGAAVAIAAPAGAGAAIDCPLRDQPYSIDSPLIDVMLKPEARAAVARIAREIHAAREQHVKALAPSLLTDHRARAIGSRGTETGSKGQARGQCRRDIVGAHDAERVGDSQAGIALLQRRDAQSGNAGHVSGRADDVVKILIT